MWTHQASALSGAHVKEAFDILFEEVPQRRGKSSQSDAEKIGVPEHHHP